MHACRVISELMICDVVSGKYGSSVALSTVYDVLWSVVQHAVQSRPALRCRVLIFTRRTHCKYQNLHIEAFTICRSPALDNNATDKTTAGISWSVDNQYST